MCYLVAAFALAAATFSAGLAGVAGTEASACSAA